KYLILVCLAGLFHKSAFIALLFYFVARVDFNIKKLLILIFMSPVLSNITNAIIMKYFPRYATYTQDTQVQEGTKAIFLFLFLSFILLVLKKKIMFNNTTIIFYNLYFFGV